VTASYILLGFVILPLWIAAGFADYLFHRATRISENSGTPESVLHLIQFSLVGIPAALALFLKVNAGFFLLAALAILLHHLVAFIDIRYANATRPVWPGEQMVHSFLEILPVSAFLLLAVAEWPQFLALLLQRDEAAYSPQPRVLSASYILAVMIAATLFNVLPYLEEFLRCMRRSAHKG
jgi:hypothetical protein